MPRQARLIVPGLPHHIVQRGHNRSAVFIEDSDYQERYWGQVLHLTQKCFQKIKKSEFLIRR